MRIPRRALSALAACALVAGACGGDPATPAPSASATATPSPTPALTEIPFAAASYPQSGSACDTTGYEGRLGRVEAVDRRTVRFTLCAPDAAFLARLAHPSLAIVDATSLARLAADPSSATSVMGSGPYAIERWVPGDNVLLRRVAPKASADAVSPVVILRWQAGAGDRAASLKDAAVDAIDAPGPAELDDIATLPELSVTPRPGLATAFLAFGSESAFGGTAVRRAIAGALDRDSLLAAFPQGSTVPTHVTPCVVPNACGGRPWYGFNAPAASAALAAASFDLRRTYTLHVPDAAVPGLPDPAGAAAAVKGQLEANIGLKVDVDVMPAADFRTAVRRGSLDGLYLDGIASTVADASGFLEPLFGTGVRTTPARRASGVSDALAEAARTPDTKARAAAIGRANDAVRSSAVIVPLAHPGSTVAARSDVTGMAASPLGADPLGMATPGDRPQLVFDQATEPTGAWCGNQPSQDAYRLCGLVSQGLYGYPDGGLQPQPALAQACTPNDDATVWTCRLAAGRTFSDGMAVDAGDVLATIVALWDAGSPLRRGAPAASFAAWDALFGPPLQPGG